MSIENKSSTVKPNNKQNKDSSEKDVIESHKNILEITSNLVKKYFLKFKKVFDEMFHQENAKHTILESLLVYIPFLGIIYTMFTQKKDSFLRLHATNALYLQTSFILIAFALWLIENLPIVSHILKFIHFVPNITNGLYYLNWIFLIISTMQGIKSVIQNKEWKVPYLYDFIERYLKKI